MTDYGFRISKTGTDVKTGADKDMVVTSKYAVLKGSIPGTTSGNCLSGPGGLYTEGVLTTFSIYHGLGYIPMFQVFMEYQGDGYYRRVPIGTEIAFVSSAGASTSYLYIYCYNNTGDTQAVAFKYYIFLDKAKL